MGNVKFVMYQRNDIDHLSNLLKKFKNDLRSKFIVTETIFALSKEHAFLYLDEVHATCIIVHNEYDLSISINLQEVELRF
ncbi:MAG: hypothetical protein ACR5KW_03930 [Wolbachia sp.]